MDKLEEFVYYIGMLMVIVVAIWAWFNLYQYFVGG